MKSGKIFRQAPSDISGRFSSMEIKSLPEEYFEILGEPKPGTPFSAIDDYRFKFVYEKLAPGSVLDVGAYFGDFLKLALNDEKKIYGSEVNQKRVDFANKTLGQNCVELDFRNGKLTKFSDKTIDNVVCMEVLEHVPDHVKALQELCRVARKKVLITVPFDEKIQKVACLHCCKYTPYSGHLHSYNQNTFDQILPEGWVIADNKIFGKKLITLICKKVGFGTRVIKRLDSILPGKGRWLLVTIVPEKNNKL